MRRTFVALFVLATVFASLVSLASCGGEAREDPAEEQQREIRQQVQQPEQSQPTGAEQTNRTVGENIQG